jgi:phenylalanyl-tRNA synthetase alpha chain
MSTIDWQQHTEEATAALAQATSLDALENLRQHYLGKHAPLTKIMETMRNLTPDDRKALGAAVNLAKQQIQAAWEAQREVLQRAALEAKLAAESMDVTLPARPEAKGCIHPLSQVMEEVISIFVSMGFSLGEGPDIEDDFHNFTALNMPDHHPARQMHDTFYLPDAEGIPRVLRTHTSSVQIRTMEAGPPPYRLIATGRVYRSDHDQTHSPMFHQVEGIVLEPGIHMGHLKGCLEEFLRRFFGIDDLPVRFRPSFFPFTEPGAEVDIGCKRSAAGLTLGNHGDWLEILGCGMVHANVMRLTGHNPSEHQGFAFGMGLERLAMLKYGIGDLRTMFDHDMRWLSHYGFGFYDVPPIPGRGK